jgi:hypothetical protein
MSNLKDYRVPAGDRFLQVLVVGCALFEFKREPRRMVPYYSPDAQLKLVGEVEPRIVANRRTLMGHLQESERTRFGRESSFFCKVSWTGELFVTLHLGPWPTCLAHFAGLP